MANFELRLDGQVVAKVEIDTNLLKSLLGGAVEAAPTPAPAELGKSVALSAAAAKDIVAHSGKTMTGFLRRIAEENGAITWGETKQTFDVKSWAEFVDGPLKKLDKAVQRHNGGQEGALIWRVEHEWVGLEKGEDEVCRLHIDGTALAALKAAFD